MKKISIIKEISLLQNDEYDDNIDLDDIDQAI